MLLGFYFEEERGHLNNQSTALTGLWFLPALVTEAPSQ